MTLLHHLRKYGVVEIQRFPIGEAPEGFEHDHHAAECHHDRYGRMHFKPVKPLKQIRKRERKK
jgi:hypothetical protein